MSGKPAGDAENKCYEDWATYLDISDMKIELHYSTTYKEVIVPSAMVCKTLE